jgi:hypothetical protein
MASWEGVMGVLDVRGISVAVSARAWFTREEISNEGTDSASVQGTLTVPEHAGPGSAVVLVDVTASAGPDRLDFSVSLDGSGNGIAAQALLIAEARWEIEFDVPDLGAPLTAVVARVTQETDIQGNISVSPEISSVPPPLSLSLNETFQPISFPVVPSDVAPGPASVSALLAGDTLRLIFEIESRVSFEDGAYTAVASYDFETLFEASGPPDGLPDTFDADGDGEANATDLCPDSSGETDSDGCTLVQFCERIDLSTSIGKRTYRRADWKNDEPLRGSKDRTIDGGQGGPKDYRCLVR